MDVVVNELDETTGAYLLKGNGSRVKYHSESLIPLLRIDEISSQDEMEPDKVIQEVRQCRQSAKDATSRISNMYKDGKC